MKFYEFNPNAYKTQDDVTKMAGDAIKTTAAGKGPIAALGKGAAKFAGMFAKDFDPSMKQIYQGDEEKPATSKFDPAEIEDYKKVLADYLRSAPLYAPDKVILQKSIGKGYSEKMLTPEYKVAIQKMIAGKHLDGKEIVLIKEIATEL